MHNLDKITQWFYYIYIGKQTSENMKIKIKEKELELHYSMRIHILYENIMNQSLSSVQGNTTSLVVLIYCAIVASMQKEKMNMVLSYDDFMDWLDEQGPDIFGKFSAWFTESVEAYAGLQLKEKEKKGDKQENNKKVDPNS